MATWGDLAWLVRTILHQPRWLVTIFKQLRKGRITDDAEKRTGQDNVNDSGQIVLYTEIRRHGGWLSFAKGTPQELDREVVR